MCDHDFDETIKLGINTVVALITIAGVCWLIWTFIKPIAIFGGIGIGIVLFFWLVGCIVKQIDKALSKL